MQITPIVDNWSARSRINVETTLYFDGIKHEVDLGRSYNETFTNQASWSLSFFSTKSGTGIVMGNQNPTGAGFFIREVSGGNRRYFFGGPTISNIDLTLSIFSNVDDFIHQTISFNHSTSELTIYLNSKEIYQDIVTMPDLQATDLNVFFGDVPWGFLKWNGNLAHVAFFNSALTAGDVRHIFENGGNINRQNHSNCVGYWPLTHRYGYRKKVKY